MSFAVGLTPAMLQAQLGQNIAADQTRLATLEQELSSGRAITNPAQDPAGTTQAMSLSAALTRTGQYVTNAQDGLGWVATANSALNQSVGVLQQIRALVLSAGDATRRTPQDLAALAGQVDGARVELANVANTSYQGQSVFAGTSGSPIAFAADGTYLGNSLPATRTVAKGVQVQVGLLGTQVFGTGSSGLLGTAPGAVGVLAQIVNDLNSGNVNQVLGADLGALDAATATVETGAAQIGATYQQLTTMSQQAQQAASTLQRQLSSVQDVNVAATITALQTQQQDFQTALWATAQTVQPSLLSFLK